MNTYYMPRCFTSHQTRHGRVGFLCEMLFTFAVLFETDIIINRYHNIFYSSLRSPTTQTFKWYLPRLFTYSQTPTRMCWVSMSNVINFGLKFYVDVIIQHYNNILPLTQYKYYVHHTYYRIITSNRIYF
jgi:hypothetical protein